MTRRHASLKAFGALAYANGGRGPDVDYARSIGTGPDGGPPGLAPLAQAVPTPLDISVKPKHLAGDLGLAALLFLLLSLPSQIFNQTLRTHHDDLARAKAALERIALPVQARLDRLPSICTYGIFVLIGSVVYTVADPTSSFGPSTFAEIAGFVGAIAVTSSVMSLGRSWYMGHRFQKRAKVRVFPLGVLVAVVLVALSRLGHFEPGYVFGIVASLSFRVKPTAEEKSRGLAVSAALLMAVAATLWLALIPVRQAVDAGHTDFGLLVLDSLLSTAWVASLQYVLFCFVPVRPLDGSDVFAWSKKVWAALYGFVVLAFVLTVLHPEAAGYGANTHAHLLSVLYPFLGFTALALAFWAYTLRYRLRSRAQARQEAPATE